MNRCDFTKELLQRIRELERDVAKKDALIRGREVAAGVKDDLEEELEEVEEELEWSKDYIRELEVEVADLKGVMAGLVCK